jgi:hypothetical protein
MLFEGNPSAFAKLGNNGFQGMSKVLKSKYVDSLCGPTSYGNRRGGDTGVFNSGYNGSYRLHGKLYWDEADIRTHFYKHSRFGRTSNMKETISVLQRAFGYSLCKNTALWWFLIVGNEVFHHNDIMNSISQMMKLGKSSLSDAKTSTAKAALIIDEDSMDYTRYSGNSMIHHLIWNTYLDSARCGTPFDVYLQSDMLNENMPDYKLYIFANSFKYDKEFSKAVKQKLSRNNAVAVWCYAPGYISANGFNEDNMQELTGIKIKVNPNKDKAQFQKNQTKSSITAQCKGNAFNAYSIVPTFYSDDSNVTILGHSNNRPSLVVKDMGKWKSVYSLTPLTKELLQGLADYAGVHVYNRDFDVVYANSTYLMIHSGRSGVKAISLPDNYNVKEIFSGKIIGSNIAEFTCEIDAPETKVFKLFK